MIFLNLKKGCCWGSILHNKIPHRESVIERILVGATSTGEIENIQIGDHVVVLKVPVESTTDSYMCMCEEVHVFFTESMELKGIIVGIE